MTNEERAESLGITVQEYLTRENNKYEVMRIRRTNQVIALFKSGRATYDQWQRLGNYLVQHDDEYDVGCNIVPGDTE